MHCFLIINVFSDILKVFAFPTYNSKFVSDATLKLEYKKMQQTKNRKLAHDQNILKISARRALMHSSSTVDNILFVCGNVVEPSIAPMPRFAL